MDRQKYIKLLTAFADSVPEADTSQEQRTWGEVWGIRMVCEHLKTQGCIKLAINNSSVVK